MGKLTQLIVKEDADGMMLRGTMTVWTHQTQELRTQAENILVIVRN